MKRAPETRTTARTERRVKEVEDALGHFSLDGDNILAAVEALHTLLGGEKTLLYTLGQRPDGEDLVVVRHATVGLAADRWREAMESVVRGRGVDWGAYNAVRPDAAQRDRVLDGPEIAAATGGRSREVEALLYRKLGTYGHDTLRALVCDGPSLLAWIGTVQPERTTVGQRAVLERVMPLFRRRLAFERLVAESELAGRAAAAALEHVNGAAWLLGPRGDVAHANAAGRARFDADPDGTRAVLHACIARTADPRFKVTPLRSGASLAGHVVVELGERSTGAHGTAQAANRFGLTPAQTRVLERVARGASNATIAAELGVAERTVEAHVTAILVKAQVPSRAALIVQIFREQRLQ